MVDFYSPSDILNSVVRDKTTSAYISVGGTVTVTQNGYNKEIQASQDLSVGAFSLSLGETEDYEVIGISVHFSSSTTQNLTITQNYTDSNYDTEIKLESLTAVQNYYSTDTFNIFGSDGQDFTIDITNTGTPAITVYVTVNIKFI